jgi:hypothetical protein
MSREDLGSLNIWNICKMAMDRDEWTRIIREAETHKEVLRYRKKKKKFHRRLIEAHLTCTCGIV